MVYISTVIPVYKSQDCLQELYQRLVESLEKISNDFEIIFVEDCGGDRSWSVITQLSEKDARVRGFKLSRNYGQHAATLCGISQASGEWIVTIDDDLEQRPEDIHLLHEKADQGYPIVYGVFKTRSHSLWRNLTSDLARKLFKIAVPTLNYDYTSFRMINRKIALQLDRFDSPAPFIDGYLSWISGSYATVTVNHEHRAYGRSNYNFLQLLIHSISIFVSFSSLPLKLSSWLGLSVFLIGTATFLIIMILRVLGGITVSGYASLMAGMAIFSGLQFLILGIMGEYISQINFKVSRKPSFLILEKTREH